MPHLDLEKSELVELRVSDESDLDDVNVTHFICIFIMQVRYRV